MRIAVISDIHSNLRALEAVLGSLGSVDAIWQLGDVVGYGPDPDAVASRLREVHAIGIRGNHDAAALGAVSTEDFNSAAQAAIEWTQVRMSGQTRTYLEALPERLLPPDLDYTLVHGSPRDPIWEYLVSTWAARASLAAFDTRYCLVGHSHIPLVFRERRGRVDSVIVPAEGYLQLGEDRLFLNPGSVGQPRDGDPRAAWLILDTDAAQASWHRVPYDVAGTQAAMLRAGLPSALAQRLSYGM
jgi:predicted phosphodiesterase